VQSLSVYEGISQALAHSDKLSLSTESNSLASQFTCCGYSASPSSGPSISARTSKSRPSISSQVKLVEEGRRDDALCSLAILGSNQVFDSVRAKPVGINDSKHRAVLGLLAMLVVDAERDRLGTDPLREVAQVHERALREKGEIKVS